MINSWPVDGIQNIIDIFGSCREWLLPDVEFWNLMLVTRDV